MLPVVLLAALTCDPAALEAKNEEAKQYVAVAAQDDAEIRALDQDIKNARATIARERSNPSGVVNLILLHNMGDAITTDLEERAYFVKKLVADIAQAKKLVAEIEAGVKVCRKTAKASPAPK